ncbi:MAG: PAS domain S-box protein, partial [Planctomycetes bacterium]|nr:PAS domain S-box protein [Planctomycetota bacterium]
ETPIVQDGKTVAIVGALTDITERKHSEDALRESEERFRSLFEHAPLGYQSLDANGNFVELNETWCQVLGYTKEEVLGRNFSEFIHPDFTEHFKENFPKFKNLGYILGVEFEMIKKDGSKIVVSFDGRIGHNDDGSFKQTHCVLHDITERKRVEGELATYRNHLEDLVQKRTSELEESKARLRQAEHLASIGTLATGIAHEINNPIGAILLAAQSALVAHGETVRAEVALHEIAQHAKRCGGIVRNVLKFAQRGTPEKRPVDLNEVIGQVVNLTQKHAAENGAAIATQLAEGLPRPIANQTELGQVLINLVQNAIEADARLITIQTSQGVDSIRLTVTDDGRGIPAGERDRVFDPFFTTRHREGGTGLGLSIVHGIIEDHGGTIEIADEPGMGTTLLIGLPLLVEASGDDDVASSNS